MLQSEAQTLSVQTLQMAVVCALSFGDNLKQFRTTKVEFFFGANFKLLLLFSAMLPATP